MLVSERVTQNEKPGLIVGNCIYIYIYINLKFQGCRYSCFLRVCFDDCETVMGLNNFGS